MSNIDQIFAAWPTAAEMARVIDEQPVKVRQWRNRGSIPPRYWPKIIAAAEAQGFHLELSMFLPAPIRRAA